MATLTTTFDMTNTFDFNIQLISHLKHNLPLFTHFAKYYLLFNTRLTTRLVSYLNREIKI